MNPIYDYQADVLVVLEEGGQTPHSQVELDSVHAREDVQTRENLFYEGVLVVGDPLFIFLLSLGQTLLQAVLVVNEADFFKQFVGRERPLDVKYNSAQLLPFRDEAWLNFLRLRRRRPRLTLTRIIITGPIAAPLFRQDRRQE